MTKLQVRFLQAAFEELSEAERDYSSRSPALGRDFADVIEQALRRLRTFPELGPNYLGNTRRLVLDRFPFAIVYTVDESGVTIVAIAHQRRKPDYWRDRQ